MMYCILSKALGLREMDFSRDPVAANQLRRFAGQHCRLAASRRILLRTFNAYTSRLTAALAPFWLQLLAVLHRPFEKDPTLEEYAAPASAAATACFQTFCGP